MRAATIVMLTVIALLSGGCQQILTKVSSATGGDAAQWKEFSSTDGAFKVLMPGDPKEKVKTIKKAMMRVDLHEFTADAGSHIYTVTYGVFPETFTKKLTEKDVNDILDAMAQPDPDYKVLGARSIAIDGGVGREIKTEGEMMGVAVRGVVHGYMVKQHLYQVAEFAPKDEAASLDDSKFLNSFKAVQ
jgi:hypothetical protein